MSELAIGQSHRRTRKRSLTPRSGSRGLARWRVRDSELGPAAPASAPPRSGSENVIPTPLPSCSCRAAAEMRVREA